MNQHLLDTIQIKEMQCGFNQLLILSDNNRLFICGENTRGRKYIYCHCLFYCDTLYTECGTNMGSTHLLQEIELGSLIVKELVVTPHAYHNSCFVTVDNQLYSTGESLLTNIKNKFTRVNSDTLWSSTDDLMFILGQNRLLVIKSMLYCKY
jgi:alpha-tubulin suppressor-like RCC1 family protein